MILGPERFQEASTPKENTDGVFGGSADGCVMDGNVLCCDSVEFGRRTPRIVTSTCRGAL